MASGNIAQFWISLEDDGEGLYGRKNPRAELGNIEISATFQGAIPAGEAQQCTVVALYQETVELGVREGSVKCSW